MSTLYKVARLGHPLIRGTNQLVTSEEIASPAFQQAVDALIATMREYDGVGIAAPQVHWAKRLFAVEVLPANPRYPAQKGVPLSVFVNPEWVRKDGETADDWEGCLSVPDLRGKVPRFVRVEFKALDRHGKPVTLAAEGFHARVLQHEMDHLEGKVYLDRMQGMATLSFNREFERFGRP